MINSKKLLFPFILSFFSLLTYSQQIGCDGERYFKNVFTDVTVTENITYGSSVTIGGNTLELKMDIYQPEGDGLEKRPVIVFAHGGGFVGGNKDDMDGICEDFAQKGYVTASISYRLIDAAVFDSIGVEDVIIKAISDMRAAVRFFREDAATTNNYGVDSNFIFAGGISAGAVMANGVGYVDSLDNIPQYIMDIINTNGGIEGNSSTNTQYSSAVQGVLNYSGSLGKDHYIDSNDPPLYSFHDEFDDIVPCGYADSQEVPFEVYRYGSCAMHSAAEAAGIKNQFYLHSGTYNHVDWSYPTVLFESANFLGEILCQASQASNWESLSTDLDRPGFMVFDISAVDENVIWTIPVDPSFNLASKDFAKTIDGGLTWQTGMVVPVSNPDFHSVQIQALDENTAWVMMLSAEGQTSGKMHKTTDGGLTWVEQTSSFTNPNEGPKIFHFFNANDGFALVPDNGSLNTHVGYVTSDGGDTWEKLNSDAYPAVVGERLQTFGNDFLGIYENHIWFGTRNGLVYHSSNKGKNWTKAFAASARAITAVAFKDELNGLAVSPFNDPFTFRDNKMYATSDGGETWTEVSVSEEVAVWNIHFVKGSNDVSDACGTYIIYSGNRTHSGSMYSKDDGQTWTKIGERPIFSMDFLSPEIGWMGAMIHQPDEGGLYAWNGNALNGDLSCVTSIEKIQNGKSLSVFPNPTSDFLTVELKNNWEGNLALRIVNTLGQNVLQQNIYKNQYEEKWEIDLPKLPTGSYYLMISNVENLVVKSVIKF